MKFIANLLIVLLFLGVNDLFATDEPSDPIIVGECINAELGIFKFYVQWQECDWNCPETNICFPEPVSDCNNPCTENPGCEGSQYAAYQYFWDFGDGSYWGELVPNNSREWILARAAEAGADPSVEEVENGQVVYHRFRANATNYYINSSEARFKVSCRIVPTYSQNPRPRLIQKEQAVCWDDDGSASPRVTNFTNEEISGTPDQIKRVRLFTNFHTLAPEDDADLVVGYRIDSITSSQEIQINIAFGEGVRIPEEGDEFDLLFDQPRRLFEGSDIPLWSYTRTGNRFITISFNKNNFLDAEVAFKIPIKITGGDGEFFDISAVAQDGAFSGNQMNYNLVGKIDRLRDPNTLIAQPSKLSFCEPPREKITYTAHFQNLGKNAAQEVRLIIEGDPNIDFDGGSGINLIDYSPKDAVIEMPENFDDNELIFILRGEENSPGFFENILPGYHQVTGQESDGNVPFGKGAWSGFVTFEAKIKPQIYNQEQIEANLTTVLARISRNTSTGLIIENESDFFVSDKPTSVVKIENVPPYVIMPWRISLKAGVQSPLSSIGNSLGNYGGWLAGLKFTYDFRRLLGPGQCKSSLNLFYQPEILVSQQTFLDSMERETQAIYLDVIPLQLCVPINLSLESYVLNFSAGYMASLPIRVDPKPGDFQDPLIGNIDHSGFIGLELLQRRSGLALGYRYLNRWSRILGGNSYQYGQVYLSFRL